MKKIFVPLCVVGTLACASFTFAESAPYSTSRYQSVLDDSKLQAPGSNTLIKQGDFAGAYNDYFYVPDSGNKWMTFEMTGYLARSELRQMDEWYSSDSSYTNKMIGEVEVINPEDGEVDEITFMQIHDVSGNSNAINKPLVRLVWERERDGIENHYWAVIKEDACKDCKNYLKVDIGEHKDDPVKFEIRVTDSKLTIKRDGATISGLNKYDIGYWDHLENYFKAGVYNQTSGTAKVQFKTLKYYTQAN
ncbi:polysaccharide lyase family 7 protein [Marinomonas sp. C2222]|uniref:Polysaccharide lyase family 7 protein n=1 Tax=Marinomonas sargassi TaxID=2984494 RepID=A0ABT2YNJ4_9GAMM|nr:polysaccharide lyase family 7 protein [Marinomonas sargassi]MCV2401463.1 polysaccharide lyase family 7 protein [Marinomonas sargassi]